MQWTCLAPASKLTEQHVAAILDTGAANSVASVTTARRLHLRMRRLEGAVTSAGIGRVSAQFAVADTLHFAGHFFRNVPFIVLPDESLAVPVDHGVTRLEPIVGFSVLRRLGRVEFLQVGAKERLRVGAETPGGDMRQNLFLAGSLPMVLVSANSDPTPLRMALDTGANRSALDPANESATIIPRLTLKVGTRTSQLSRVPISKGPENCDGTLGQDALRSGGGYIIDFEHMTVEVLATKPPP